MYQNYLKSALRNLWKYKGYTFINLLGLTIGIACVLLIMLYVQTELSFDQFHQHKDQIYRLNIEVTNPQSKEVSRRAVGPYRLADELKVDFDDLEHIIRFAPQPGELVEIEEELFAEEQLAFADPEVFQVFDFDLIEGDKALALQDPFSVVVSESIALKYFGTKKAVGKTMTIRSELFEVTGIMKDVPLNSQFQYNVLVSMNCARQVFSRIVLENWGEGYVSTFVMLPKGKDPNDYQEPLSAFVSSKLKSWEQFSPKLNMQPLSQIYLRSKDISSFVNGGDITYVYAFSFIALFILMIACINYMNLATARSSVRAMEVGMRKVVGASREQLIGQFLSESIILTILALLFAVLIVWLALPSFNQLADRQISISLINNGSLIFGLVGITLLVGIAAGSYPALILSSFKPIAVFSGKLTNSLKGGLLRKVLVAFQFTTSIFLLIVTGVVYQQLQYCKNMDLGFDKEHLIIIPGTPLSLRERYDQFRERLLSNPKITNAAASSRVPPGNLSSSLKARPEGVPEEQQQGMQTVWTDFDFIETMGFEMAAGRSFSKDYSADANQGFIINEEAVEEIGWTNESAIGKTFGSSEIRDWNSGQWENRDGRVIGVLKNFYFESMKEKIEPTVYFVAPYMAWSYVIRIRPEDIPNTINYIESTWKNFVPETPFVYEFVDENFASLYRTEERQGRIFGLFATLAIFIGCLGLIGLASFTAEQKKKEIGIRKVLGATRINIVTLLSKEFTLLVAIAFVLATPIAWTIMENWLQDFAYRISIGLSVFLMAGSIALLIAWITVGIQTLRAASENPVRSLQRE